MLSNAHLLLTLIIVGFGLNTSISAQTAFTAGDGSDVAFLEFEIRDNHGDFIPARLTFLDQSETELNLFTNHNADPTALAVRKNIIYSLHGHGTITVPAGTYAIHASRGIEWSLDSKTMELQAGSTSTLNATLTHEVDTAGWISGDFHLHTLTYSGHGDSNMNERLISIIGEGVEFAVATDHNHLTDYNPVLDKLDAHDHVTAVTGNEVSTSIGHFIAFPLDPSHRPVNPRISDANELFRLIREEPNTFDTEPVIQLNHPRWGNIDYFGQVGLDPITGTSRRASWSTNFDSIEIFNENSCWGYYDAETTDQPIGASKHSVLQDWFNLLNRGNRFAAVGNSDSHTVHYEMAGYPRNFVRSSTDDPSAIDPVEVADAIRNNAVFTTTGPFIAFSVNGSPMGEDAVALDGKINLEMTIQAASWIDCDRVKVVINGVVVDEIAVPDTREVVRLKVQRQYEMPHDSWLVLLVEGDDSLAPLLHRANRIVRPLAVTNPVWIDVDGDNQFTSVWDRALASLQEDTPPAWPDQAAERCFLLIAAGELNSPFAPDLVRLGLADPDRRVQLASTRVAERLADQSLIGDLERCRSLAGDDGYLQAGLLRAMATCDPTSVQSHFIALLDGGHQSIFNRYADELASIVPAHFVTKFAAAGYFPNPDQSTLVTKDFGPESGTGTPETIYIGKNDTEIKWRAIGADDDGYVDLRHLGSNQNLSENAIAYVQTWLHTDNDQSVYFMLGTDDGCRMWVNGELIFEDNTRHGAGSMDHVARMQLQKGWNRILFKIENGNGGFGLIFSLLDDQVDASAFEN